MDILLTQSVRGRTCCAARVRRDAEYHARLTVEQVYAYRNSSYAQAARDSLLAPLPVDVNEVKNFFIRGRNHLLVMLCITKGNWAGVLKHMTLSKYEEARSRRGVGGTS